MKKNSCEYNVAFSSSGARFAAHVGVLAYLQDNEIKVSNFSGTSGGAVVAAWGANNLSARKLLDITLRFGYAEFFIKPSLQFGGIFDHILFGEMVSSYCMPRKNLSIVSFNLLKMQKHIWTGENINLKKAITASTCIPGLFKPVLHADGVHIDGIFASFCPDDIWESGQTISVQLKCENKAKSRSRYPFDNFIHVIEKTAINLFEVAQKWNNCKKDILYIQPDVSLIAQTDFFAISPEDHIELFRNGYEAAKYEMGRHSLLSAA